MMGVIQGAAVVEMLKIVSTLILLLRQSGVTKETIDEHIEREWTLADKLNKEING